MENERLAWLKSIYPQFKDRKHLYENVYRPYDLKYYKFFDEQANDYTTEINPQNIIGIDYAYAYNFDTKINWHQLLWELHRFEKIMENFKSKEEVVNHLHHDYTISDNDSEEKMVYKYGNYYFTISGQHRLCLAKFLDVESIKVNVTEFKLDKGKLVRFKKLKAATERLFKHGLSSYYTFEDLEKASKHEDFYLNRFNTTFRIKIDLLSKFLDYYEQFYVFKPLSRIQSILNDFLYPNRIDETVDLFDEKDFKRTNSSIILHKKNSSVKIKFS